MFFALKRSRTLLTLGFLLSSIVGCISPVTQPQTVSSLPEPKILHENVELNPSLNARVTKILFFESGRSDMELRQQRTYQSRFAQATTRTIYTEVRLDYPQPGKRVDFTITLICKRENGTTFRIEESRGRAEADWTSSSHWVGMGNFTPGNWDAGAYKVDVQINGEKVATGSFEIYERAERSASRDLSSP